MVSKQEMLCSLSKLQVNHNNERSRDLQIGHCQPSRKVDLPSCICFLKFQSAPHEHHTQIQVVVVVVIVAYGGASGSFYAKVYVGSKGVPTILNSFQNRKALNFLHIVRHKKVPITILDKISGVIKASR